MKKWHSSDLCENERLYNNYLIIFYQHRYCVWFHKHLKKNYFGLEITLGIGPWKLKSNGKCCKRPIGLYLYFFHYLQARWSRKIHLKIGFMQKSAHFLCKYFPNSTRCSRNVQFVCNINRNVPLLYSIYPESNENVSGTYTQNHSIC